MAAGHYPAEMVIAGIKKALPLLDLVFAAGHLAFLVITHVNAFAVLYAIAANSSDSLQHAVKNTVRPADRPQRSSPPNAPGPTV